MKNTRFTRAAALHTLARRIVPSLLLSAAVVALAGCGQVIYKDPQYNFAGRPIPPSGLLQRVMASYTANGSSGGLEILDGQRDIRSNVQNTIPIFLISGYSGGNPVQIINYPEQEVGYVYSNTDGTLTAISYAKEAAAGVAATLGPLSPSVAASTDGTRIVGANQANGQLIVTTSGAGSVALNLPNVDRVALNRGNTVILAMLRNSNAVYRVVKLNQGQYLVATAAIAATGAVDCQPLQDPIYCVVPVPGTYDRPVNAYYSLDGNFVYVLNCGPECGGATSGITVLQEGALTVDTIPNGSPLAPGAPSPIATLPTGVPNPFPVPGGVTTAISDGTNLYVAGQSRLRQTANGAPLTVDPGNPLLYTGYLTTVNQTTFAVSNPVSVPDGTHNKLLFADDNTLWVGSTQCATGKRQATGQNVNCLARIALGTTVLQPQVVPLGVVPGGTVTVPYPNGDQNLYYYGSLTGICWVQEFHKVYTAYGGQIHAFSTVDGTEINNTNITIQGTVLDVAYMDALDDNAD